ncbi:MAG: YfiR family protein [Cyclobacteriaceae bacterium]|nr:YfiR family protein [Cyclobacteriaceae bacterium]
MKNLSFTVLAVFSLIGSFAQEKPTYELHAGMVYNFIKYIQWPNETEDGDFIVGVMGDDNLFDLLKTRYDGKPKGSKKYVIKKLASAGEAASCQVVYLGKSKNKEFEEIKNTTTGKPVLTITDGNGLGQKGSCINFKVIDGKLKFELNQATVGASNLKVSSQLSSMAIVI